MEIKLHFMEEGQGFPLVLLHGNGGDSSYFKRQIPHFSKTYRVIAVDTRGHGNSPRGDAPFTLSRFAEDLKELLDELGISRCHLLGFSDGANIAMYFALRYPRYIKRLILNGGNLSPWGVKWSTQIPVVAGWLFLRVMSIFNKALVKKWEILDLMATQPNLTAEELSALAVPTLVVAGEKDMIRAGHTEKIAAAIPGSECVILPGDHFVARRGSEAFNALVENFLCEGPEKEGAEKP